MECCQTFMCEVSKMPATSLFTPSMEHLATVVPAIQGELSKAEQFVQALAANGGTFGESASRISEWLEDDAVECFFELGMDKCPALKVRDLPMADSVCVCIWRTWT